MFRSFLMTSLLLAAPMVNAQSTTETLLWQSAHSFAPISRTAESITGMITLSDLARVGSEGGTMRLTFENGAAVDLVSLGVSSGEWSDVNTDQRPGEVFRLSADPGTLENGNTLCGDVDPGKQIYAVFSDGGLWAGNPALGLAVFVAKEPPTQIGSDGLCATFLYDLTAQ